MPHSYPPKGTINNPYKSDDFTPGIALEYYRNGRVDEHGNKEPIYVDMASHMVEGGGGDVLKLGGISTQLYENLQGLPPGTRLRFETSSEELQTNPDAQTAKTRHSNYLNLLNPDFFSDVYVWGRGSAGFRGDVVINGDGTFDLRGQLRPYDEDFDFEGAYEDGDLRAWIDPFEWARWGAKLHAGLGQGYEIKFVGDEGRAVDGTYSFTSNHFGMTPHLYKIY